MHGTERHSSGHSLWRERPEVSVKQSGACGAGTVTICVTRRSTTETLHERAEADAELHLLCRQRNLGLKFQQQRA